MLIDTYETPRAESLLRLGRGRHRERAADRRLVRTEAAAATIFVAAAASLALLSSTPRSLSLWPLAVSVITYIVAGRVRYPVGSAWTAPTQLAFVPMLFVLPTPYVPLIVATCSLADRLPQAVHGEGAPERALIRIGDSFYALGPALVLVLFGAQVFSWQHWPVYLLAFAAQVAFDAGAGLGRTWFAERVRPSGQLPMVWLYVTDACLSCAGVLIAGAAAQRAGLMLVALPLVGLLGLLAREREQRLEYSLALSRAYDEVRSANAELHDKASLLAQQKRDIEVKNEEIELARRGLEDKAAQLALASKCKSEFLANVSHELRTPLNAMLLLSRLLAENSNANLSEREVEFARTIHGAGNDLLSLIDDILDLSKVEAGRMELDLAPMSPSDVGADAERAFRPLAEEKRLAFAIELDPTLPATIVSDRQRLGQVVKNLLSNAFKFTPQGGVTLSIGYAADGIELRSDALRAAERVIAISVADTGVGIPDDKLNLIFEAFKQADGSTSRRYGGTGLGLSISREIARLLGGEIHVESVLGRGSRFSLLVPLVPAAAGPVDEAVPGLPPGPPPQRPPDRRADVPAMSEDRETIAADDRVILVLDPDGERARSMLAIAQRRGARAVIAADAADGTELAREHQPAAIVLAGDAARLETAVAELKRHADTRHIPVVAVGGGAARLPALRLGVAAFVERSLDPAELELALTRVESLTSARAARVALAAPAPAHEQLASILRSINGVELVAVDPRDIGLALRVGAYDLAVVAFDGRGSDGFGTLRELVTDEALGDLPLIAYVSSKLGRVQRARLDALAKAAVISVVDSPELLAERATLFLHRREVTLPASTREALDRLGAGDGPLRGKKVLVVDDDIRSGFALTSMLEQHGMKVVYAENGREGMERLRQHANTDLVLLDAMMPEMDGYEMARAVRAIPRFERLPIIALTAQAMLDDRDKAIAAGASDYIAKPVDVDVLVAMMRTWLAPRD